MKTAQRSHSAQCSTSELKILGDYWTLAILQSLTKGEKRFCQLERDLSGVSPTTLTNRLKKLEDVHLIQRSEETLDKLSVVYTLTKKGIGIMPVLREIKTFAETYL